jgi:hypothetical protein
MGRFEESVAISLMRDVHGSPVKELRMFERVRFVRGDQLAETERMLCGFVPMENGDA